MMPSSIPQVGKRDERCGVDSGWVEVVLHLGRAVDALGSLSPIAHANLKPRAPRRLRLYTYNIEAYAPRGPDHLPSQAIATG